MNEYSPQQEATNTDSDCSTDDSLHVTVANPLRVPLREKVPVAQQLLLLGAILLLLLGGSFSPKILGFLQKNNPDTPNTKVPTEVVQTNADSETTKKSPAFSDIQITADAAYVWDVAAQKALYKKNEDKQRPLASVTKLMTTLLAYETLQGNATVAVGETAIKQDGDSGLLENERFKRDTLSDLTLLSSSNDGAYALAAAAGNTLDPAQPEFAFVHAMNVRAKELGLHNTYFKNPTGLDLSEDEAGAYGTAKDMAFLMEYIVLHAADILEATQEDTEHFYSDNGVLHNAANTNYFIGEIPGIIGSKTGYTDLAGGNLVIAFDAGLNHPIVIAVLGSTRHDRFTDVQTLVQEAQKYVTQ